MKPLEQNGSGEETGSCERETETLEELFFMDRVPLCLCLCVIATIRAESLSSLKR